MTRTAAIAITAEVAALDTTRSLRIGVAALMAFLAFGVASTLVSLLTI